MKYWSKVSMADQPLILLLLLTYVDFITTENFCEE